MVPLSKRKSEEDEILEASDSGLLKRVKDVENEIARHRRVAEELFKTDARINIRLSFRDLPALQACALKEGIPYQTLVSSVLHSFVDGQLVDKAAHK